MLGELLGRNGIASPDGRPLFAYNGRGHELETLRNDLRVELARDPLATACTAGFCAYAATQFCRSYDGRVWPWRTVLDPLQWSPAEVQLHGVVRRGLTWWKRPLLRGHGSTRYLETVVCEGG